ncbi:multicopper oxidase domain-containing protein [Sorangium sp. So ce1097]|uniref:multicopper oxidase domain-containing protein n=1 Tax=Sorangium sp. So ce1097 TaxID=3133330 RepID=UPI003F6241D9
MFAELAGALAAGWLPTYGPGERRRCAGHANGASADGLHGRISPARPTAARGTTPALRYLDTWTTSHEPPVRRRSRRKAMQPTPPQPAGPTNAAAAPRRHPWIIGAALVAALAAANGAAARHAHDAEAASGDGHAHEVAALPRGAFSKLRFVNDSGRLHPIHLHGMFFKVLSRDGRPADEPFFRDTVLVHPREAVDIGVVPLDEGRWMLHCHILEHAEAGMMSLLDVKAM